MVGADGSAARTADGTAFGIPGEIVSLADLRQQLLDQEPGIGIAERVVLYAAMIRIAGADPIRVCVATLAGSDEDTDRDRHLLAVDQVVHNCRHAQHALGIDGAGAILEHQDAGRAGWIILGRHIDPVLSGRVGEDPALE
jgi:hypothetical protein